MFIYVIQIDTDLWLSLDTTDSSSNKHDYYDLTEMSYGSSMIFIEFFHQ